MHRREECQVEGKRGERHVKGTEWSTRRDGQHTASESRTARTARTTTKAGTAIACTAIARTAVARGCTIWGENSKYEGRNLEEI
jgi:hypothetical protein